MACLFKHHLAVTGWYSAFDFARPFKLYGKGEARDKLFSPMRCPLANFQNKLQ